MLVSTMVAGTGYNILRGHRLHITNLEDREFTYTVRYWVTPPSSEAGWERMLNRSFILYTGMRSGEDVRYGLSRSLGDWPLFRRTHNGVYTASSWVHAVPPNHTVSVELAPLTVGSVDNVEGYVTLELPVLPDADLPFRSVPQADRPVRVLLNPETLMRHKGLDYGSMYDSPGGQQTGWMEFPNLPFDRVEPLIPASGKAENEVTPNAVLLLTHDALQEAVNSRRIRETASETKEAARSFGATEDLPAADRMGMLIQLLCELDNQKKVLVELNKVLSENRSGVTIRQSKN